MGNDVPPQLVEAQKPHTDAVTCIVLSPDCKTLVTSSVDGTIFFFDAGEHNEPIGMSLYAFIRVRS